MGTYVIAAYQPSTSAGITATHASTSATECQSSLACPTRKRGRAIISPKVPALPAHWTSTRRPPAAATARNPTATRTSRLMATTATHVGMAWTTTIVMAATASSSRSAVGSSTLPSLDTWLK